MPTENILSLEVTQGGWIHSFIQGKHSQIGHYDREKMLKCTHLNYIKRVYREYIDKSFNSKSLKLLHVCLKTLWNWFIIM